MFTVAYRFLPTVQTFFRCIPVVYVIMLTPGFTLTILETNTHNYIYTLNR